MRYSYPEKGDEKGGMGRGLGHAVFGFIRVEDIYGNNYRNVFFKTNIDSFKQHIKKLVENGIIDISWVKNLSPLLKP